jgi:hypothetical protein
MIDGPKILFLHIVSSLQTFKKISQRKRGVERFGKTGVSLSVVKRSSLNSGALNVRRQTFAAKILKPIGW